jgi:hypothetical protein
MARIMNRLNGRERHMTQDAAKLTPTDVASGLRELDDLCKDEYGISLAAMLHEGSALSAQRMQRLTGIVLKKKFAKRAGRGPSSATNANYTWPWAGSPEMAASDAPREFAILEELRKPGSWNSERIPRDGVQLSWDEFIDEAENERGLFKFLALYVSDRIQSRQRKSIREYLQSEESRKFEAGLDLAVLVFDSAVTGPIAAVIGVPAVAVGIALVGIQFGYRKLTDPNEDRIGDGHS